MGVLARFLGYCHIFEKIELGNSCSKGQCRRQTGAFLPPAGAALVDTMRLVATDVRGGVFAGCGDYMPEEAPHAVAEQVVRFLRE